MESWSSQAENIMDPTILTGSCSSTNSGWTPMTTWGGLSLHRDLAISANPGGVYHWLMVSSGCDSIFRARETDGLTTWVVAVDFDHPRPQAATNTTLAWALWFLLQLHSWVVGGSMGSDICEGVILIQLEGRLSSRTSKSVNEVRGSMAHQSSSMLCQLARLTWHQQLGFLHPNTWRSLV